MLKYHDSFARAELYYWQRISKSGNAEVDYLTTRHNRVLPLEVKANTRGSMQSLYLFMRKKHLTEAMRISLENFSEFEYVDTEDNNQKRHITILPLYALSNLF